METTDSDFRLEKVGPFIKKEDLYLLLQEIPFRENGFGNYMNGKSIQEFDERLKVQDDCSNGIGLKEGYSPETTYCLYFNDKPVGIGRLRHVLTEALKKKSGNISYSISPSQRKRGFGTKMLNLLLDEAKRLGLKEVFLTCDEDNIGSYMVIEKNGGILIEMSSGIRRYIISF